MGEQAVFVLTVRLLFSAAIGSAGNKRNQEKCTSSLVRRTLPMRREESHAPRLKGN